MFELLFGQRGGRVMRFLLLGTSTPEGDSINLWGIDLETYSVVNIEAANHIACKMQRYNEYIIECVLKNKGIPVFGLIKILEEKKYESIELKEMLELTASYSRAFISNSNSCMLAKLDICKKINVSPEYVELLVSFAGLGNINFCIEVKDWHWCAYWKNQSVYAECDMIIEYMNSKDVYFLIEHKGDFMGKALQCVSMLVM